MKLPFKNHTVFAGYVVNEPELRILPASQEATISVRLVSRYSYKDGAGAWQTQDEFITAVMYRKQAEDFAGAGIRKGDFIHIEGRRLTRKWTDGQGRPKTAHEVVVTDWHQVQLQITAAAPSASAPAVPAKRGPGRPPGAKPAGAGDARTEQFA